VTEGKPQMVKNSTFHFSSKYLIDVLFVILRREKERKSVYSKVGENLDTRSSVSESVVFPVSSGY